MFLLASRSVLRFYGNNVIAFLNRLFTCNLAVLKNGEFVFGCLLNSKGRFLFDFFAYREGEEILVDIANRAAEEFKTKVLYYDIFSEIKCDILVGTKVIASDLFIENWKQKIFQGRFISFIDENQEYKSEDLYNIKRIKNCLPDGEFELTKERSIILECSYEEAGAVDFNKGCYVGQEFITKAKRLGDIKKCLACVEGYKSDYSLVVAYKEEVAKGEIEIEGKRYKICKL